MMMAREPGEQGPRKRVLLPEEWAEAGIAGRIEDKLLTAVAAQLDTPKGATEVPREPALGKVVREKRAAARKRESHRSDLNRRPLDYESRALPLSYGGVIVQQQLTTLVERSTPWCQWWCQNPARAAPPTAPLT
jgi:hypothetical protein